MRLIKGGKPDNPPTGLGLLVDDGGAESYADWQGTKIPCGGSPIGPHMVDRLRAQILGRHYLRPVGEPKADWRAIFGLEDAKL